MLWFESSFLESLMHPCIFFSIKIWLKLAARIASRSMEVQDLRDDLNEPTVSVWFKFVWVRSTPMGILLTAVKSDRNLIDSGFFVTRRNRELFDSMVSFCGKDISDLVQCWRVKCKKTHQTISQAPERGGLAETVLKGGGNPYYQWLLATPSERSRVALLFQL